MNLGVCHCSEPSGLPGPYQRLMRVLRFDQNPPRFHHGFRVRSHQRADVKHLSRLFLQKPHRSPVGLFILILQGLAYEPARDLAAQLGLKLTVELFHFRRKVGGSHPDEPLVAVYDLPEFLFAGRRLRLGKLEPRIHDFASPLGEIVEHPVLIASLLASRWFRRRRGYRDRKEAQLARGLLTRGAQHPLDCLSQRDAAGAEVTSPGGSNPADCWRRIYPGLENCRDWKDLASCLGSPTAAVRPSHCLMEQVRLMANLDLRHRPYSASYHRCLVWFEPGQRCWTERQAPKSRRCVS